MANTYDLTQTGSEVQAILNDANNIKGAGAQTTLTTDYILLKDTNGQYHKILKDSFTEACRNVLAGLLVNNDKGTTISQIAAVASGDFGSITPANLASVLGGQSIVIPANSDLNNYKNSGDYGSASAADTATITNRPPNAPSNAFAMTVINMGTTYKFQFYRVSNSAGILFVYIRCQYGGSGAWTTWNQISLTALT